LPSRSRAGKDARYLHVGDAVYQKWEIDENRPSLLAHAIAYDRASLRETTRLLGNDELRGLRIVPSHDAQVLSALPQTPRA
jgi:hypothetical protein